jgi:allantoate deiminase
MDVVEWCLDLAGLSETPDCITRTFLSPPMHEVHRRLGDWMQRLGMSVQVDAIGNLRGCYAGRDPGAARLLIGSHLDTVPAAGAYDGVLGVVMGLALVEALRGRRLRFGIEVVAFSEEEGVRFGVPFLGSLALVGALGAELLERRDSMGCTVAQAVREFGLDPACIPSAALRDPVLGYLEFHIEQGPVLESLDLPLGVVEAIAGQSRLEFCFQGSANHAGTTPMRLRRDALAGASEWIGVVERVALSAPGLVATVGRTEVRPGAGNVIAGEVHASLDVRHADDEVRRRSVDEIAREARSVAGRRGLTVDWETRLDQPAVTCDAGLAACVARAVEKAGYPVHHMVSGAGHDAMIMARKAPVAMLFLRSPGGISHHPDESVWPEDVAAALNVGLAFLDELEAGRGVG